MDVVHATDLSDIVGDDGLGPWLRLLCGRCGKVIDRVSFATLPGADSPGLVFSADSVPADPNSLLGDIRYGPKRPQTSSAPARTDSSKVKAERRRDASPNFYQYRGGGGAKLTLKCGKRGCSQSVPVRGERWASAYVQAVRYGRSFLMVGDGPRSTERGRHI